MVTTNSATLVNKGLEVIEAHLLFDVAYDAIEVAVHPQSIVHSMVEFVDGSTIVQASPPDMRLPIALGLGWPDRVPGVGRPLDWTTASTWSFEPLDGEAFPAVALAKRVGLAGSTYPAVFNAANEVAVEAFHAGRIGFLDIVDTVERVVDAHAPESGAATLESVLAADGWRRRGSPDAPRDQGSGIRRSRRPAGTTSTTIPAHAEYAGSDAMSQRSRLRIGATPGEIAGAPRTAATASTATSRTLSPIAATRFGVQP